MLILPFLQEESGTERQVQCLQLPCCEPGYELPANTLLTFLDAVGQCCSRGNSKKPGTLLSHCRCVLPWVKGQSPKALSPLLRLPGFCRALVWLVNHVPSIISQSLVLGFPMSPDTAPSPEVPHLTLGQLQ